MAKRFGKITEIKSGVGLISSQGRIYKFDALQNKDVAQVGLWVHFEPNFEIAPWAKNIKVFTMEDALDNIHSMLGSFHVEIY